jgi:hypothetical protein
MILRNGQPFNIDAPFSVEDGTQFPAGWFRLASPEQKQALGFTEVPDPVPVDDRFYFVSQIGEPVPKQLDEVKKLFKSQAEETAYRLLLPTDWMIVRKVEENVDVPVNIATFRTAVRQKCRDTVATIEACTDLEQLQTFILSNVWPVIAEE